MPARWRTPRSAPSASGPAAATGKDGRTMSAPKKRFQDMDLAELQEATKEYDRPVKPKFLNPPAELARAERRARKAVKTGRPPVGQGATAGLVRLARGVAEKGQPDAKARDKKRCPINGPWTPGGGRTSQR